MTDQELNNIWTSSTKNQTITIDNSKIIVEIASKLGSFHNSIKNRNRIETGAALLMIPVFIYGAFINPSLISKMALALTVPWLLIVIVKLKKIKKQSPQNFNLPLLEFLKTQKGYLIKEMNLLKTVTYWYILPPMILGSIHIWDSSSNLTELATRLLILWAVGAFISYLNKRALRKNIAPLIVETENTIKSLNT
jgi:hypothetical protein